MKKAYILTFAILLIGGFLIITLNFNSFFSSQKGQKINDTKISNSGISSKISSFLNTKKVIMPIKRLHGIIYKAENKIDFFVTDSALTNHLLFSQPIYLSSNINGTKLYDNDINLPEGNYQIESFSPQSATSLRLNFPNIFDIDKQKADKRPPLTSIISIGMENDDIQLDSSTFNKIILLRNLVTRKSIGITIVPNDFSNGKPIPYCLTCPPWIEELYGNLRLTLQEFQ